MDRLMLNRVCQGGGAMLEAQQPHIVKDFSMNGTRIKIADNYCRDKTNEEVAQILRRIAYTAQAHLTAAAMAEKTTI